MGFRFWRRITIAPGVSINLSKSGASLSLGPRGAKFTIGPGGKRITLGIPGTGLFYTTKLENIRIPQSHRLSLGFFRRLITPDDEEALIDGCRALLEGNEPAAFEAWRKAEDLADAACLAGFVALKQQRWALAKDLLQKALAKADALGKTLAKYKVEAWIQLPITEEVMALFTPSRRGVLLALVEVEQHAGSPEQAIQYLEALLEEDAADPVARLSLAELLWEQSPTKENLRRIVELSEGVANENAIEAALLLYRARALRKLGLVTAARDVLTKALRRKKDRPQALLHALRFERALCYEALGQHARARADYERIYAEDPNNEEVAAKLGLSAR